MEFKRKYFKYTTQNILGMIGLSTCILADTFFVANGVGLQGLSALNLSLPFYNLMYGLANLIGSGGSTIYNIYSSRGQQEEANGVFTLAMVLTMLVSIPFMIGGFFFTRSLAEFVGANREIIDMVMVYLRYMLIFSPLFILEIVLNFFNRNDHKPTLAMVALFLSSLTNIVFDYIFIYIFHMGMRGAILATCMFPALSVIIFVVHYAMGKNTFKLRPICFNKTQLKQLIINGVPSLITEYSTAIMMLTFNTIFLKLGGNLAVAAYGVVANISIVAMAMFNGLSHGAQPLFSEAYGKQQPKMMKKTLRYSFVESIVLSLFIYLTIFSKANILADIFNGDNNPMLTVLASQGMKIYFAGIFFAGINILMSVYFVSIFDPRPAYLVSILRGLIFLVPLAILLSKVLGMNGTWLSFPVTEALVSLVVYIIYRMNKKGLADKS